MKKLVVLIVCTLVLVACGGTKKIVKASGPSEISETVTIAKDTNGNTVIVKQDDPGNISEEEKIDTETNDDPDIIETQTDIPLEEEKEEVIISPEIFNHAVWNLLLREHVNATGNVNYEGFRQNKGQLRDYIASLGIHMPNKDWTQQDQLAYWMNAYNAMTVDLILRNLPLKSIKDINKPWNQRLWKLGDKWYNLDEIEHQILRKMNDPRIHFGINCASFSCPPLLNEAFTSAAVDQQLDTLARRFVNDTQRNTISSDRIRLSKVFSWFAKDFKKEGSLIDYLNKYAETPINSNAKKSFMDYNWTLNN